MGFMTIDGQRVEFTNEPNVLTVIRNAEIDIPTLCYHSELSIYGACRLCTVEDDRGKTFASCAEPPRDGMVIYTNTPRLMRYRRTILELLLAAHDRDCTTCVKSGECHLLELAHRMGVDRIRFKNREPSTPSTKALPPSFATPISASSRRLRPYVRQCPVRERHRLCLPRHQHAGDPGLQQDHRPDQLRQLRPVPGGVSHRRDQHQDQHR